MRNLLHILVNVIHSQNCIYLSRRYSGIIIYFSVSLVYVGLSDHIHINN